MSIKIVIKAAGVQDVEEISDTANNGLEALNIIKDDANKNKLCSYGLILKDKNMPVMDGCTATSKIR